jgi:hypothetical protein
MFSGIAQVSHQVCQFFCQFCVSSCACECRMQNIDQSSNENTVLFLTYSSNGQGKDFIMCMSYRTKQADRIIKIIKLEKFI